jgi:hypothetical protein
MTKFEKNKYYTVGKISKNSELDYDIKFMKNSVTLPAEKFIESATTFEEWIQDPSNHNFKAGELIYLSVEDDEGKNKYVAKHTVPPREVYYEEDSSLNDGVGQYFRTFEEEKENVRLNSSNKKYIDEMTDVLRDRIKELTEENNQLKKQIQVFNDEKAKGLSDNVEKTLSDQVAKLQSDYDKKILEKEKLELEKNLDKVNQKLESALADNVAQASKLAEIGMNLMNSPIGQGLTNMLMSKFMPSSQAQIQQPQPQVSDDDILNDPQV